MYRHAVAQPGLRHLDTEAEDGCVDRDPRIRRGAAHPRSPGGLRPERGRRPTHTGTTEYGARGTPRRCSRRSTRVDPATLRQADQRFSSAAVVTARLTSPPWPPESLPATVAHRKVAARAGSVTFTLSGERCGHPFMAQCALGLLKATARVVSGEGTVDDRAAEAAVRAGHGLLAGDVLAPAVAVARLVVDQHGCHDACGQADEPVRGAPGRGRDHRRFDDVRVLPAPVEPRLSSRPLPVARVRRARTR